MSDLNFGSNGLIKLPSKYHGDVTFSKRKWDTICSQPERTWYRFNGEKIATTLIAPDYVRHHSRYPNQFFYYKQFSFYKFGENLQIPAHKKIKFFAVIIDTSESKVCTSYPLESPKAGKQYQAPKK